MATIDSLGCEVRFLKTWQLPFKLLGESRGMKNSPEGGLLFCSCQAVPR